MLKHQFLALVVTVMVITVDHRAVRAAAAEMVVVLELMPAMAAVMGRVVVNQVAHGIRI
jgi:hypothetical protein